MTHTHRQSGNNSVLKPILHFDPVIDVILLVFCLKVCSAGPLLDHRCLHVPKWFYTMNLLFLFNF